MMIIIFLQKYLEAKFLVKIYEDEFVLSFYDINPKKKVPLVIPKGKYTDLDDFSSKRLLKKWLVY